MTDSSHRHEPEHADAGLSRMEPVGDADLDRANGIADRGRAHVADAFDAIGERIEDRGHVLRSRGGSRRAAGQAAIRAGHAFEAGAEYLRDHDVDEMKREIETRVRERPLASLAVAAVAGFVLARIVR